MADTMQEDVSTLVFGFQFKTSPELQNTMLTVAEVT